MIHNPKTKLLSVITSLAIAITLSVSITHAQTPSSDAVSLQKLIIQLQEQVKALQTQVVELKTQVKSQEKELVAVKLELQFTKTIGRGASGDDVKQLQGFLKNFPDVYPEGVVSGYFGPLTETAVKKFQEKNGLEPVGVVGPKTRAILNDAATGNCSSSTARPCFDRRAGDKIFILNEGSGNNAFAACLNNPSENKTGELFERTALCGEEKIQFCYEGQSANLIRKFGGNCQVSPAPLLSPSPAPEPIVVPPPLPPAPTPSPPSPTPTPQPISQSSITVLSPNGGEKIPQGSVFTIQWSSTNLVSKSVNIAFYQYKDGTWTYWNTIATNVPQSYETGTFTYAWKTLNFDIDRDFYIEVSGAGVYPSPTDKSDKPFHFISNYSVQVISPNGGESWSADSSQLIRWSATKLQSFPTAINLLKGGLMYRTLSVAVLPDYYDGTAFVKKLTIPSDVPSGADYTVEIVVPAIWSTIPEVRDVSDKPFSIVSSSVVAPTPTPLPPPPAPTTTINSVGTPTNTILGWFKGTKLAPTVSIPGSVYHHALYFKYSSVVYPGQSFRVYLKRPGEISYKTAATFIIPFSIPATGCAEAKSVNYSSGADLWKIECSTDPYWRLFSPLRSPSFYPIGVYSAYIVALNEAGFEGPASPVTINTLLPQSKIVSPVGAQSTTTPTIAWMVPAFTGTNAVYYASVLTASSFVWTGSAMVFPGNSQYSIRYAGPALDSTKTYYTNLWGEMPGYQFSMDEDTMPAFTVSASSATVSPPPSVTSSPVTVISPNGGECRAGIFPITWSSSLDTEVAYWDLSYSLNYGSSSYYFVQGESPSARLFNWATFDRTTPDNIINSSQAIIKVEARGPTFPYGALLGTDISDSVFSLSATCPGGTVPVSPTNFTATLLPGTNLISVKWTDNSFNEVGFAVNYRIQGSSRWEGHNWRAYLGSGTYTYGLPAGTYEFKVRAGNQYGYSADSNIAIVTTGSASTTTSSGVLTNTLSSMLYTLKEISALLEWMRAYSIR